MSYSWWGRVKRLARRRHPRRRGAVIAQMGAFAVMVLGLRVFAAGTVIENKQDLNNFVAARYGV